MGVCPSRALRREGVSRSTQTTHAYNCNFFRVGRYYDYLGVQYSVEAPGEIVVPRGFVRDVATQGPVTCVHSVEYEDFEGVGAPVIGNLVPLPRDRFAAQGHDIRRR